MQSELKDTQRRFTAWLREPEATACPPDVPRRRMEAYRELLTNNVESAISSCFPVLKDLVGEPRWQALIGRFFAVCRCHSPIYRDIPGQFLAWLESNTPADLRRELPFLQELAHYEWMELALDIDPTEIPEAGIDRRGDLRTGVPVLNPLARLLTYRFPVHRIGPDLRPTDAGPSMTQLVMVRRRDHGIGFLEVNPLVASLFEALRDNHHQTGLEVLAVIQKNYPSIPAAAFREGGIAALHELAAREIVLGTRA